MPNGRNREWDFCDRKIGKGIDVGLVLKLQPHRVATFFLLFSTPLVSCGWLLTILWQVDGAFGVKYLPCSGAANQLWTQIPSVTPNQKCVHILSTRG